LTIVSKLLHGAVVKVRERAGADQHQAHSLARVLNELFDLQAQPPQEQPRAAAPAPAKVPAAT
jgi:hypothetical protein